MSRYYEPLCLVIGPSIWEIDHFIAHDLDPLDVMGMQLRPVTYARQVQGLRFDKVIFTPRAWMGVEFLRLREVVAVSSARTTQGIEILNY